MELLSKGQYGHYDRREVDLYEHHPDEEEDNVFDFDQTLASRAREYKDTEVFLCLAERFLC